MISQPRRIAASSLMKRLRTTLGAKVNISSTIQRQLKAINNMSHRCMLSLHCHWFKNGILIQTTNMYVRNQVGMRMGFGIKDESEETCIHFVTTGYLVLAQHTAHSRT